MSPIRNKSSEPVVVTNSFTNKEKAEKNSLTLSMDDIWMDQYDHPLYFPEEKEMKVASFEINNGMAINNNYS